MIGDDIIRDMVTGRLLSVSRVAKYFDVLPQTVRNWCKKADRRIRFVRVGNGHYLIDSDSIDGWPKEKVRPSWDEQNECVYFAQDENGGPVKIGYTSSTVRARLRQLSQGIPYPCKLIVLLSMRGPKVLEQHVHIEFSHLRVKGEWFTPAPELSKFIVKHGGEGPREEAR